MLRAEDLGNFYRIIADNRDLNYEKYFEKGDVRVHEIEPYTSHNTKRLTIDEMIQLLKKLPMFAE